MINSPRPMFKQQEHRGHLITTFAVPVFSPEHGPHIEVTQIACDPKESCTVHCWQRNGFAPKEGKNFDPMDLYDDVTSPESLDEFLKTHMENSQNAEDLLASNLTDAIREVLGNDVEVTIIKAS